MKAKKNTTNFVNDNFDIDDPESPELTDKFFKNAVSFAELPQDLQMILNVIQNENKQPKKTKIRQNLNANIL